MIQELKKDIKAVVLSEYKLMACILVMLIIFWKFINKLISTYIVCITETVSNDSLFIALIFFLWMFNIEVQFVKSVNYTFEQSL